MRKSIWGKILIIIVGLTIVYSCSKKRNDEQGEVPLPNPGKETETGANVANRKSLLENLANNIITPRYESFHIKLDSMVRAYREFASNPTETSLVTFRKSWIKAYIDWQKIEMFNFGPADANVLQYYFNIYPATIIGIENNIISGSANLNLPSSYSEQGFPALDYLLNGYGSDAETIVRYTTDANAAKRIAYLNILVEKMSSTFYKVYVEWNLSYKNAFINNTAVNAGSPISIFVNSYIMYFERNIRSGKIGYPANAMGDPFVSKYPEKVEAYYYKNLSLTLAKTALQAYADVFNGKSSIDGASGPSLKTYLDQLGAKDSKTEMLLSQMINSQFDIVNTKLNAMTENLSFQVTNDNQKMLDTYAAMQSVVRMLKVDMTSAMTITITYVDTDGD